MLYVSIFVELLRSRPVLAVWIAALLQAALWTLVPALFYAGPPGDVPVVLAIGSEFRLGSYMGPPFAFWLAEIAFILAGHHLFGVYLLSQVCVVVTYLAVFALGRAIVGAQHAALAVLLMVGIATFTVPTPDFGPGLVAMALWAVILLLYWRAVVEGRRGYWLALVPAVGLLLLTTHLGLLFVALLVLFTFANSKARAALGPLDPRLTGLVAVIALLPYVVWLADGGDALAALLARLLTPEAAVANFSLSLRQMAVIVSVHAGLVVLIALVIGLPWAKGEPSPVIVRPPVAPFGRQFVYFFALMPSLAATVVTVLVGSSGPVDGIAPLVILSGLAVVVAAGDAIELSHQRVAIPAWFGLLLVPPAMAVAGILVLPWIGIELAVNQPARAVANYFSDSFQRRTGTPLPIVAGDPRTAALVALGSASRPSVFFDATPERSPWVTMGDVRTKGAIVVWPTTDTAGTPPPGIKERFPDIVPEVPRAFERPVAGRLPLLRIGWAVIRPQSPPPADTPAPPTSSLPRK